MEMDKTAFLSKEERDLNILQNRLVSLGRESLVGRMVFQVSLLPDDFNSKQYKEIISKQRSLPIPIIHKDFIVDCNFTLACIAVLAEEDKLLLTGEHEGWSALGIEGIATATGRSVNVSAGMWPANCYVDIVEAIDRLKDSGHSPPYTMIVPPKAMTALRWETIKEEHYGENGVKKIYTTHLNKIMDYLQIEAILESKNLFSSDGGVDSALVVKPGKDNFDMVIAQDLTVMKLEEKNEGKIYEAIVPRILDASSICEIEGLN